MDNMVIVEVLYGYRGLQSNNVYMKPGKHGVNPSFAKYLVENGHAVYVDEPSEVEDNTVIEDEPSEVEDKPKRKRKKSSE